MLKVPAIAMIRARSRIWERVSRQRHIPQQITKCTKSITCPSPPLHSGAAGVKEKVDKDEKRKEEAKGGAKNSVNVLPDPDSDSEGAVVAVGTTKTTLSASASASASVLSS